MANIWDQTEFAYQRLNTLTREFRPLELTGPPGKEVRFHMKTGCTPRNPPAYTSLSYTWGPPGPTRHITIDGRLLPIQENLYNFLCKLGRSSSKSFWIDQICIDQRSVIERNHQVSMMADIYKSALETIIWLDVGTPASDRAMKFLSKLLHRDGVDWRDDLLSPADRDDESCYSFYTSRECGYNAQVLLASALDHTRNLHEPTHDIGMRGIGGEHGPLLYFRNQQTMAPTPPVHGSSSPSGQDRLRVAHPPTELPSSDWRLQQQWLSESPR